MNKRSKRFSRVIRVAGLIISACLFVLSWASIFIQIPQIKDWRYGLFIGFVLFVGFTCWQFYENHSELERYRRRHPRLEVIDTPIGSWNMTEFYRENTPSERFVAGTATLTMSYLPVARELYGSTDGLLSESDEYSIALATYRNQRPQDQEVDTALSVSAHMSFYNEKLVPLLSNNIDGRWADTQEPSYSWLNPQPKQFYLEIDIPANTERRLCIVAKQKEDDECYVYNLDTYQKNRVKRSEVSLPKGKIYVQIVLRGSNFDDVIDWFELDNSGKGKDIKFCHIKEPENSNRLQTAAEHRLQRTGGLRPPEGMLRDNCIGGPAIPIPPPAAEPYR